VYVYIQDDNFLTGDDIFVINQVNDVSIVSRKVSTLFANVSIQENIVSIVSRKVSTLFTNVSIQENNVSIVSRKVSTLFTNVSIQENNVSIVSRKVSTLFANVSIQENNVVIEDKHVVNDYIMAVREDKNLSCVPGVKKRAGTRPALFYVHQQRIN
jgi:uncharacterized protein YbcI